MPDGSKKRRLTAEQIERRAAEARLIKRLEGQADHRPKGESADWQRMLKEEIKSND